MKLRVTLSLVCIMAFAWSGKSQITVDNTPTPTFCVNNVLLGAGVTATNITFSGTNDQIGTFDATGTSFPIDEGIILATGDCNGAVGPNNNGGFTLGGGNFGASDPDLTTIAGIATNDAAILEFDFVPVGDTLRFNYVFGSDEYLEYVGSINDVFGFFLSGPGITGTYTSPAAFPNGAINIAQIPGGGGPVTINNVNTGSNASYYVDNGTGATPNIHVDVQYDGYTVVLTATAVVQCGQTYHIKIAIADASDTILDSGVFLEAESFSSDAVEVDVATVTGDTTIVEGCDDVQFWFIRPSDDTLLIVDIDITGTAINGTDYVFIPDSIIFPAGIDSVLLNVETIEDDFIPGGNEPPESITITVYTISPCGDTLVNSGTIWIIEEPNMTLQVSNDTTLTCPVDSIPIVGVAAGGIPGYAWTWSTGGTSDTIWVPGNVNGTFTYTVELTDTCQLLTLYDTVVVTINVPTPLNANAGNDTTIACAGPLTLTGLASGGTGPGTYLYSWAGGVPSSNPTATINITSSPQMVILEVTDGCFTQVTDTLIVTISANPPVVTMSSDTTVNCPGDPVTVSASATGGAGAPYTFDWVGGPSNSSTYSVNPTSTTTYVVQVYDACTGPVLDSVTVTVPVYDPIVITLDDLTPTCPGNQILLNPSITGGNPDFDYAWNTGDTSSSITVSPSSDQSYTVTVTDECGNTQNHTVNVTMPNYAPLSISMLAPDSLCENTLGQAVATVTGGAGGYSFSWSGPAAFQGTTDSIVQYTLTGSGDLVVTVTDQCGTNDTQLSYIVAEACELVIPNVFTPGGDGYNDVFFVENIDRFDNHVIITNRWGRVVFETTNYKNDWDGGDYSDGTYFYVITLTDGREYSGHVTMIRE